MKILVSACLLGVNCKYSGKSNQNMNLWKALEGHECILICPEQLGGLKTPRIPAEIVIKEGFQRVYTKTNENVSEAFFKGAEEGLKIAQEEAVEMAILKDGSPSCGVNSIYDGTFKGIKKVGKGLFVQKLEEHDIFCIDEYAEVSRILKEKEEAKV